MGKSVRGGHASSRAQAARGARGPRGGAGGRGRERQRRPARRAATGSTRRLGWSRRVGAALGLVVLGSSIVLAGQALDPPPDGALATPSPGGNIGGAIGSTPRPDRTPRSGASPQAGQSPTPARSLLPAPRLDPVAEPLVAAPSVDLTGHLPDGVRRNAGNRLRVYVNGSLVRERRLPRRATFRLRDIPLEQGANTITLAIFGAGGEGADSAPVVVTRDDVAPTIHVTEPAPGSGAFEEEVVLTGRTEPGADVRLVNRATQDELSLTADPDGAFSLPIPLAIGANEVVIVAADEAGNRGRASVTIEREQSSAAVVLTVSHPELQLDQLPANLSLKALVTDDEGAPVDGAEVTFSLSVPGHSTSTYRTATEGGVARWTDVRVPAEGALAGDGYATVLVVLPTGRELQESALFTVR